MGVHFNGNSIFSDIRGFKALFFIRNSACIQFAIYHYLISELVVVSFKIFPCYFFKEQFLLPQPDCCAALSWFLRMRFYYTSFLYSTRAQVSWKDNTMAKDFSVIVF